MNEISAIAADGLSMDSENGARMSWDGLSPNNTLAVMSAVKIEMAFKTRV